MNKYSWGMARGSVQHLFQEPSICILSACGKAYSGELGVSRNSKRKKCKACELLEKKHK